jgi:septal ring-binding cell division protein DamX/GNAT superfamily N-acetyltransferase
MSKQHQHEENELQSLESHHLELRILEEDDYPTVKAIMDDLYKSSGGAVTKKIYLAQLTAFPEGQFCIANNGIVVAAAFSVIVDYEKFGDKHTYDEITGDAYLTTHDPSGDVLYGVEVIVAKEYQGLRLGRRLYEARKELCVNLNLKAIMAGGRIPNYSKHAQETHRHKLMQIILFGQPELDKNLQGKNIRQLRERITHSFYLEPMNQEQTSDYLQYRMQAAGCPWPQVFTTKAEKLLSKASEGLTRRVNILADKALMAAYASSSIQPGHQYGAVQQKVLPKHVKAAIKDSGYGLRHLLPWSAIFSSIAVVAVVLGLYFGVINGTPEQAGLPRPAIEISENIPASALEPEPVSPVVVEAAPVFVREEQSSGQNAEAELARLEITSEESTSSVDSSIPTVDHDVESLVAEAGDAAAAEVTETTAEAELQTESVEVVEAEPVSADATEQTEPAAEIAVVETPGFNGLPGLIGVRARASSEWLQNIANKNAYTVQMASFPIVDEPMLEEYLQLLALTELLNETYLCLISRTPSRPQQWVVIHGDFSGVSRARDYIESLPTYSRQYEPFVRNSNSIACLSDMPESSLLAL